LTSPVGLSSSNPGTPVRIIPVCLVRYADQLPCYSAGPLVLPYACEIARQ
jgi:hypothetical protein